MLDVTLEQLRSELPLAINIHRSAAEASVYVSCGELSFLVLRNLFCCLPIILSTVPTFNKPLDPCLLFA